MHTIDPSFENFETEELTFYGEVEKRLEKANLSVTHGIYSNLAMQDF